MYLNFEYVWEFGFVEFNRIWFKKYVEDDGIYIVNCV